MSLFIRLEGSAAMGGKPSKGTRADRRLAANKPSKPKMPMSPLNSMSPKMSKPGSRMHPKS